MSQDKYLFCELQASDRDRVIAKNELAYAQRSFDRAKSFRVLTLLGPRPELGV
jgi:hypothetical protein